MNYFVTTTLVATVILGCREIGGLSQLGDKDASKKSEPLVSSQNIEASKPHKPSQSLKCLCDGLFPASDRGSFTELVGAGPSEVCSYTYAEPTQVSGLRGKLNVVVKRVHDVSVVQSTKDNAFNSIKASDERRSRDLVLSGGGEGVSYSGKTQDDTPVIKSVAYFKSLGIMMSSSEHAPAGDDSALSEDAAVDAYLEAMAGSNFKHCN